MLEIFVVIQTLVLIAILTIFIVMIQHLRKGSEELKERLEAEVREMKLRLDNVEAEVKPVLDDTKKLIATINIIGNNIKDISTDTKEVVHKVKVAATSVEAIFNTTKASFDKTRSKLSLVKLGFEAGASTLLSFYLKKIQKKEDKL